MKTLRKIRWTCVVCAALWFLALAPSAFSRSPQAKDADSECLVCHSQPDLKSQAGKSAFVDPAKHKASVHASLPCSACHADISGFPHPKKIALPQCSTCHAAEATDLAGGIHSALGDTACTSCHGPAHDAKAAATLSPKLCGTCHAAELKDFLSSAHGAAAKNGDPQSPTCQSCHGVTHKILTAQDPASPVAKKNLSGTCGSCHENSDFLAKHQIPFAHPVQSYLAEFTAARSPPEISTPPHAAIATPRTRFTARAIHAPP